MTMRRGVLAGLGMLVIGATVGVAGAQPARAEREGRPGREGGPGLVRMQRELGLNDEQAAQLRRLWSDERKGAIRRRADTQIAHLELEEALAAPTLDEKLVAAKAKALSDLQAAGIKARVDRQLAMRKLLTPEQREKLGQLGRERREARPAGRERGRGHGRAGGPGPGAPGLDEAEPPNR